MGRNEGEGVGWESAEDPAFGFSDSVMETESRNIREESDIARWSGGGVGGCGGPQDGGVDCMARGRREGVAIGGVPGGGEGVVLEAPRVVGVVSRYVGAEAGVAVDGIRESLDREGEGFYDALHYKRVSGPVVVSSVGETGVMKAGGDWVETRWVGLDRKAWVQREVGGGGVESQWRWRRDPKAWGSERGEIGRSSSHCMCSCRERRRLAVARLMVMGSGLGCVGGGGGRSDATLGGDGGWVGVRGASGLASMRSRRKSAESQGAGTEAWCGGGRKSREEGGVEGLGPGGWTRRRFENGGDGSGAGRFPRESGMVGTGVGEGAGLGGMQRGEGGGGVGGRWNSEVGRPGGGRRIDEGEMLGGGWEGGRCGGGEVMLQLDAWPAGGLCHKF